MAAGEPVARRPRFPRGYGIHDSENGLLPWGWAADRLERSRNYWITTAGADGAPHAMPVWGIWADGAVVFSTSAESRKGRNLARDPRVVVHLESGDEPVVLQGEVEMIAIDDRLADLYEAKYDYRPERAIRRGSGTDFGRGSRTPGWSGTIRGRRRSSCSADAGPTRAGRRRPRCRALA